jgi:hypothetical protein
LSRGVLKNEKWCNEFKSNDTYYVLDTEFDLIKGIISEAVLFEIVFGVKEATIGIYYFNRLSECKQCYKAITDIVSMQKVYCNNPYNDAKFFKAKEYVDLQEIIFVHPRKSNVFKCFDDVLQIANIIFSLKSNTTCSYEKNDYNFINFSSCENCCNITDLFIREEYFDFSDYNSMLDAPESVDLMDFFETNGNCLTGKSSEKITLAEYTKMSNSIKQHTGKRIFFTLKGNECKLTYRTATNKLKLCHDTNFDPEVWSWIETLQKLHRDITKVNTFHNSRDFKTDSLLRVHSDDEAQITKLQDNTKYQDSNRFQELNLRRMLLKQQIRDTKQKEFNKREVNYLIDHDDHRPSCSTDEESDSEPKNPCKVFKGDKYKCFDKITVGLEGAINKILEFHQVGKLQVIFEEQAHQGTQGFKNTCTVDGISFNGYGPSKKEAKKSAALLALAALGCKIKYNRF